MSRQSYQGSPVIVLPYFIEVFLLQGYLFWSILFGGLDTVGLHAHSRCQHLIAELPLPEFLVFYHVGISIPYREVYVEVFDWFGDMSLNASFLFLNFHNALVGRPVSFDIFEGLFEEKWQILGFAIVQGETLDIDVAVFLGILLEEYDLQAHLIKGLK
jgi:hypothetical protein